MAEQYTILEHMHPTVVAPTLEKALDLAKNYMKQHPAQTMYVVKLVAVIETPSTQKVKLLSR